MLWSKLIFPVLGSLLLTPPLSQSGNLIIKAGPELGLSFSPVIK